MIGDPKAKMNGLERPQANHLARWPACVSPNTKTRLIEISLV
jgi:hypothetical protein